ncbi:hypothetical protein [Brevundimonas diminuta]|uniref:hypothetical protein n=1 Tax=Brevundimonas diminuta TaxID=293 RepID=UPI0028AC4C76|nr:hypothetical protein [Brevundimonas diminuta]
MPRQSVISGRKGSSSKLRNRFSLAWRRQNAEQGALNPSRRPLDFSDRQPGVYVVAEGPPYGHALTQAKLVLSVKLQAFFVRDHDDLHVGTDEFSDLTIRRAALQHVVNRLDHHEARDMTCSRRPRPLNAREWPTTVNSSGSSNPSIKRVSELPFSSQRPRMFMAARRHARS